MMETVPVNDCQRNQHVLILCVVTTYLSGGDQPKSQGTCDFHGIFTMLLLLYIIYFL